MQKMFFFTVVIIGQIFNTAQGETLLLSQNPRNSTVDEFATNGTESAFISSISSDSANVLKQWIIQTSTNQGQNWQQIDDYVVADKTATANRLAIDLQGRIAVVGSVRSADGSRACLARYYQPASGWTDITPAILSGRANCRLRTVALDSTGRMAMVASYLNENVTPAAANWTLLLSRDSGQNWEEMASPNWPGLISAIDDLIFYRQAASPSRPARTLLIGAGSIEHLTKGPENVLEGFLFQVKVEGSSFATARIDEHSRMGIGLRGSRTIRRLAEHRGRIVGCGGSAETWLGRPEPMTTDVALSPLRMVRPQVLSHLAIQPHIVCVKPAISPNGRQMALTYMGHLGTRPLKYLVVREQGQEWKVIEADASTGSSGGQSAGSVYDSTGRLIVAGYSLDSNGVYQWHVRRLPQSTLTRAIVPSMNTLTNVLRDSDSTLWSHRFPSNDPNGTGRPYVTAPFRATTAADLSAFEKKAFSLSARAPQFRADRGSDARVALGHTLFFDKRLSLDNSVSCNSCHQVSNYGVDSLPVSPGINNQLGARNSPTVINSGFLAGQFWDSRAKQLEDQALKPILNPIEMGMLSETMVVERLQQIPGYVSFFASAFPGEAQPLSFVNIGRAIAAFERTLVATASPFDRYMAGDDNAISPLAKQGIETVKSIGCTSCHSGPNFNGRRLPQEGESYFRQFPNLNHASIAQYAFEDDKGREQVTGEARDKNVRAVPSWRNIEKTAPYFHNGAVADLNEAVRVMGQAQLNVALDDQQRAAIVEFLKSLTSPLPAVSNPIMP